MLGHGIWRVLRNAANSQAQCGGGRQVHVVKASAAQGNESHAEAMQVLQRVGRQPVIHKCADCLCALRSGSRSDIQPGFVEDQRVPASRIGTRQEFAVIWAGAEDGNLHVCKHYAGVSQSCTSKVH